MDLVLKISVAFMLVLCMREILSETDILEVISKFIVTDYLIWLHKIIKRDSLSSRYLQWGCFSADMSKFKRHTSYVIGHLRAHGNWKMYYYKRGDRNVRAGSNIFWLFE